MNVIKIPRVLLPADGTDMHRWAVNACDQYTSDEKYWADVEGITRGVPSAFNLIFPEIYLKSQPEQRIERINKMMREYLSGGVFKEREGLILVERTTPSGTRTGIVLAIDLEEYSFEKGAKTPVRSTEATILERIPPRVEIRKNAALEMPHAMLLFDDEKNVVLGGLKRGDTLYDFDLMMNGGRVKGCAVENPEEVINALYSLADGARAVERYGMDEKLLFAVGDGNHSLATAKTCWENIKKGLSEAEKQDHPARFALVEAVNIYDPALEFKPIHRYVKTPRVEEFTAGLKTSGGSAAYIVSKGVRREAPFDCDIPQGIRALDEYIARFTARYGGEVDYIHGGDELTELTRKEGVGIILPAICKDDFFRLILEGGNLPRKTFSMGEGDEKRYYIEARKIV